MRQSSRDSVRSQLFVSVPFGTTEVLTYVIALLVWDGLLCLDREKRQIWNRKITGSSILYLVIRYSALFEYALEGVGVAPNTSTQVSRDSPYYFLAVSHGCCDRGLSL